MKNSLGWTTKVVLIMAVYFLGGVAGREWTFKVGETPLVYPPFGIAMAVLVLFGPGFWPGVAFGAAIFTLATGGSFGPDMLGTVIGNTVGAVACAYLLDRFAKFNSAMERVRDVAALVGLVCILGTPLNAVFNAVGQTYAGGNWDNLFQVVLEWWVPNGMACLVVAPFLLTWGSPSAMHWSPAHCLEGAICLTGLCWGTWFSFNSVLTLGVSNYPFAYLPYPFLVWGVIRFGQRGAATGTLVVTAFAMHALLHGRGPFVMPSERESMILIGSYVCILAITNLLFGAFVQERLLKCEDGGVPAGAAA